MNPPITPDQFAQVAGLCADMGRRTGTTHGFARGAAVTLGLVAVVIMYDRFYRRTQDATSAATSPYGLSNDPYTVYV